MKKVLVIMIQLLVIIAAVFIGYELLQHSDSYADDAFGIFIPSAICCLIYDIHKYRD